MYFNDLSQFYVSGVCRGWELRRIASLFSLALSFPKLRCNPLNYIFNLQMAVFLRAKDGRGVRIKPCAPIRTQCGLFVIPSAGTALTAVAVVM